MRKHEAIDLMKLYSIGDNKIWNKMLTECFNQMNINRLAIIRYQIQAGMDDLAKNKLNNEQIIIWYCRLMKSLEITAKRIIKRKHPLANDNPLLTNLHSSGLELKRKRDLELKKFLEGSSY